MASVSAKTVAGTKVCLLIEQHIRIINRLVVRNLWTEKRFLFHNEVKFKGENIG